MKINIIEYVKNDKPRGIILGDLSEIFQLLEDNGMTLQSMAGSQYLKLYLFIFFHLTLIYFTFVDLLDHFYLLFRNGIKTCF